MKSTYISIIIPVFNTSRFLRATLDSVLTQSFKDYEIILVDDGSTDESPTICDEFQTTHNNIKVIHQNNQGVTSARKAGIEASMGEYILFLDSDDLLPENALQTLYSFSSGMDVVIGFDDDPIAIPQRKPEIMSSEQLVNGFLSRKINVDIAAKLWKRELFANINSLETPRHIKLGEDFLMNIILAQKIKSAILIYKSVYIYIQHDQQTTRNFPYSLEYEKQYYHYLKSSLTKPSAYKKGLVLARLYKLRALTRFGYEKYDTNDIFVRNTCKESWKYIVSFEDRIFSIFYKNQSLCKYLLQKIAGYKRHFLHIYH